jgi:mRNA interferase MazF
MNRHLATVFVVPLTTTVRAYPARGGLHFGGRTGQAALGQIRTIDRQRLVKRLGGVAGAAADEVAAVLVETFTRAPTRS